MAYAFQRLVSFGDYTFPATLQSITPSFGGVLTATGKAVGMSGGIDHYGGRPTPAEIGKITVQFTLIADTPDQMTAKRDAVLATLNYGAQWLVAAPTSDALGQRRVRARVNDIQMPEDHKKQPDLWQAVTMVFHVPDPRWLAGGANTALWDAVTWGSFTWGGTPTTLSISAATSGTATLTNAGNTPTPLLVTLETATSARAPYIARVSGGEVAEWVRWGDVLTSGYLLLIDPASKKVYRSGVNARDYLTYKTADWLTLEPGANTLLVRCEEVTTATVRFYWWDAYR